MANFEKDCGRRSFWARFFIGVVSLNSLVPVMRAQQVVSGFAVERFYPSPAGSGWFVMDDLNIAGGFGAAIGVTTGYATNPLVVTGSDGRRTAVVSDQGFINVGAAAVYNRYRVYLNLPIPYLVSGNNAAIGPYQVNAPSVSKGTNPDTIADPSLGFDVRFFGQPGNRLRLGASAQLFFPSGERSDYVSDGRYRGMLRFLAAGDSGAVSYAGQLGVHIRTLNDSLIPGGPNGSEFLFGGSAGRKILSRNGWTLLFGPEIYGETAFHSFFSGETAAEALLTTRLERVGRQQNLRLKVGIGHDLVHDFGAPEWRLVFGVEIFGQK
jgi:hypothetical protein